MDISIVIPVYNEQDNITPLHDKLGRVLDEIGGNSEVIYVDDGSTDNTLDVLRKLDDVKIIVFRRNFGQTAALNSGFSHARGDIIVVLDADLQNDPEDIPKLIDKINEGYDVVSGWRHPRKDPLNKKIPSFFSNWLHRFITGVSIHDSGCSLKAYKRECLQDLELLGEMHRFIPAMLAWRGYQIGEIRVKHHKRKHGKSKYGWKRFIKGFLDLITIKFWMQYSARPMHLFGAAGIAIFTIGLFIGLYLSVQKFLYGIVLADKPLLLLSVLCVILGVQFIIFGLLAGMIIRIYYGHGRKQSYSIREKIGL